jgi:hypothetical protein
MGYVGAILIPGHHTGIRMKLLPPYSDPEKLHGVTSHGTEIFTFTAVRTFSSNSTSSLKKPAFI